MIDVDIIILDPQMYRRQCRQYLVGAAVFTATGVVVWSDALPKLLFAITIPAQLDQGWGSLVGSLAGAGIGLMAIAWQTGRSYRNMIAHQDRQAELDRAAREHQACTQLEIDDYHRRQDAVNLAGALIGELSAIHAEIGNFMESLHYKCNVYKDSIDDGFGNYEINTMVVPKIQCPVFLGNASNLGLLGASQACDVAMIYTSVTAGNNEELITTSKINALAATKLSIEKLKVLMDRISYVALRLTSYINMHPDPGPLADFDRRDKQV